MAEARSAVAFQFLVNDEGVLEFNYNKEAMKLVVGSIKHHFVAFLRWGRQVVKNDTFPFNISSILLSYLIILSGYSLNCECIRKMVLRISYIMPGGHQDLRNLLAFIIVPGLAWFILAKIVQSFIKTVLRYYLRVLFLWDQNVGSPYKEIRLLIFFLVEVIKKIFDRKTSLYCFQNCLPTLALPSLNETIQCWLRSIRPLKNEQEYIIAVKKAEDFKNGIGRTLQRFLCLKHLLLPNYVSDWWEKYVYLASRVPLPINSNYYGVDHLFSTSYTQAERAAVMIYYMMEFKDSVEKETLKPVLYQGRVPLCSSQYTRLFNTARIPCVLIDTLKHTPGHNYIIVYNKGHFYRLNTYSGKQKLSISDLYRSIKYILEDTSECSDSEVHLPSLTALPRSEWARIRLEHFTNGVNRTSYEEICKSAFLVSFDEHEAHVNSEEELSETTGLCLHGRGYDRWFDKSMNLIVFKNGMLGMTVEHSWADAPIIAQLNEQCFKWIDGLKGSKEVFKDDGSKTIYASVLKWDLSKLKKDIEESYVFSKNLVEDCEMYCFPFEDFGKNYPKKVGLSPDGFIQAALQIAYYKDVGEFGLTYESAMTRMFKEGRTETTRSCTVEMCDFVKALDRDDVDNETKIKLLKAALENHVRLNRLSLMGYGCDRHLFGLLVVAKTFGFEAPFLQEVLSEPWKLSTSQTPVNLSEVYSKDEIEGLKILGGGFGPVHDDGYGVSYIITGEKFLAFHVSSKVSSKITNSRRMAQNIKNALRRLKALMDGSG